MVAKCSEATKTTIFIFLLKIEHLVEHSASNRSGHKGIDSQKTQRINCEFKHTHTHTHTHTRSEPLWREEKMTDIVGVASGLGEVFIIQQK